MTPREHLDPEVRRAMTWWATWRGSMLRRYAGKWVAIRGHRVVATAKTYDSLKDRLEKLRPGPVLISREESPAVVVY